jgi:hypothetical protein
MVTRFKFKTTSLVLGDFTLESLTTSVIGALIFNFGFNYCCVVIKNRNKPPTIQIYTHLCTGGQKFK